MTKRFLTAEQILKADKLTANVYSAEETLRVALNHHANARTEIHRQMTAMWRELGQIHDLDPHREYQILYQNGQHEIVEVEQKEDGR